MTTVPVEMRELLERAATKLHDRGHREGYELRALLAEQPQAGAGQFEPDTRKLAPALAMVLQALDRDAADGKPVRAEMAEVLRNAIAKQRAARHDQGDEVRRPREALESARSHCVTWQGEPHEYSCSVHKAVIGVIDAALTHSPKGEEE